MKRQILTFFITVLALAAILTACGVGQGSTTNDFPCPEPDYDAKITRDFSAFEAALAAFTSERREEMDALLAGKTVLDIQQLMNEGNSTAEELVTYYVDRIRRYDVDKLNSVMTLNPEALDIARALDAERAESGARSPMHGIPILLKDNIATGDGMPATAGAYALKDWVPDRTRSWCSNYGTTALSS